MLEGPIKINDFIYQQWFQFKDPIESLKTDNEEDDYYESISCAVLYQEGVNNVTIANSILKGFKGEEKIKKAVGSFDTIIPFDSSSTYPWFIDYDKSSITVD